MPSLSINWASIKGLPTETLFFIAVIVLLTLIMHISFTPKAAGQGPTLLTTLGIFATFFGIATGLLGFNAAKIQESVPALLEGLKTAFWASVFGVGCAITLKGREYLWGVRATQTGEAQQDEVTAADLARLLKGINSALVGNDEGSLISQLKLARQDTNDRLDALKAAQIEALQKLSQMGTKTLIEALQDVIRDFNVKITEQFGENFKQLNAAVFKLVEWQENYRLHVEQINVSFQENADLLKKIGALTQAATEDYAEVIDKSKRFTEIAEALRELLTSITTQKQQLAEVTKGLANLLLAASGSLPEIEQKVLEIAQQLEAGVTEGMKRIREGIEGAHQATLQSQTEMTKQMSAAVEHNQAALQKALQSAHQALVETGIKQGEQANEMIQNAKRQIDLLDEALAKELNSSITSLGLQLTALSEKFVEDYTPLTDRLRKLLEMAR